MCVCVCVMQVIRRYSDFDLLNNSLTVSYTQKKNNKVAQKQSGRICLLALLS